MKLYKIIFTISTKLSSMFTHFKNKQQVNIDKICIQHILGYSISNHSDSIGLLNTHLTDACDHFQTL